MSTPMIDPVHFTFVSDEQQLLSGPPLDIGPRTGQRPGVGDEDRSRNLDEQHVPAEPEIAAPPLATREASPVAMSTTRMLFPE